MLLAFTHRLFSISASFVIITRNWFGRHAFLRLHNALLDIQRQQQRWQQECPMKSNQHIESYFHNCLIAKSVMTLLQSASHISGKLGINPNPTLNYVLYIVFICMAKNVTHLTVFNFYFALLNVCQQLQQLNWHFKEVVQVWLTAEGAQVVHNAPILTPIEDPSDIEFEVKYSVIENAQQADGCRSVRATAIADMCRQYVRICHLAKSLYQLYEWQVLLFLVVILFGNVMSIFYFLVYLSGKVLPRKLFSPTLFPQICLINVLDLCCFMVICEQAMTSSKETSFILKELCQSKGVPAEIVQDLEMLNIFMAGESTRFRFCGLFEWNFRTGASFMTATILYLVVLVQFDYENL
ncbi:gustatory receptor for bitter taste 22e-like [Anastrepha ludens]|uniref:gustatory receptor for bitter taste 22e-like n=1 Tax=Anastrepha ludens TaxID=28586 RepID=UPI0023AF7FA5|nr:gustatory receptor for bitter taste 22e-like [Anastrepha ludens]